MSATILEGVSVAKEISANVLARANALRESGINPCLGILRVGERPDDLSYERGAMRRAAAVGVDARQLVFDESATTEELVAAIHKINDDDDVHGLLILRPLPSHIDEKLVCDSILPQKDVDACSESSLGALFMGGGQGFAPCTAQACLEICDHYGIELSGKHVVVVGRSLVIGKPLALLLLDRNATVTIAHSRTECLEEHLKRSDIIASCAGRAQMIGSEHVSPGQTVIDVGINVAEDGRIVGDVHFDEVSEIVDAITPVPRGVGSVTTSVLCMHVVQAAESSLHTTH